MLCEHGAPYLWVIQMWQEATVWHIHYKRTIIFLNINFMTNPITSFAYNNGTEVHGIYGIFQQTTYII